MPSTYTTNNGIELIGTGEQSGTWGDTTNTNLTLVDASLDGHTTVTLVSAGTSGSPNSLPITDGAASNGRNRALIFTDGGDLGASVYVQLTPSDAKKIMFVRNSLSGSRDLILFQGTYNASNDFVLAAGKDAIVKFDGAGSGAVASAVLENLALDAATITTISNTTLNTATVNATTVDTTNIEVTNVKAKDGTASATIANSTGVMTIASSVLTTTDINGGTIDGAVIGGASPAAGTFTTANATTVDTTNLEVTTLKAKDGTAAGSIADATGVVTLASSVLTTTDINGGTIDGTVIGGSSAAAGTFTTVTASGDLTIADKIVHSGDTNTSIRFPAADTVTVETSGTERLRVDSTGNVGIGNSNPTARLEVVTSSGTATAKIWSATNTTPIADLELQRGTNATWGADTYGDYRLRNDTGALLFQYGESSTTTERMRIDSSGNVAVDTNTLYVDATNNRVGIGNTSPTVALDVTGSATTSGPITATDGASGASPNSNYNNFVAQGSTIAGMSILTPNTGTGGVFFGDPDNNLQGGIQYAHTTDSLNIYTGGANRVIIDASGDVGIGVSPSTIPTVAKFLAIGDADTGIGQISDGELAVFTNSGERVRFDNTGNVGIGTSNPLTKFDVRGDVCLSAATTEARALQVGLGRTSNGYSFIDLIGDTTYTDYGLRLIRNNAGANTVSQLVHRGTGALAFSALEAGSIRFDTTSTTRMTIDSSGNVLIGDTQARATVNSTGTSVFTPSLQQTGTTENASSIGLFNYSTTTFSDPAIAFSKSLNATIGSHTAVTSGTQLGGITWNGSDGSAFVGAANIVAYADATASSGSLPGRLEFETTGTGDTSPTTRMTIDSAGFVGIGTVSPSTLLHLYGSATAGADTVLRVQNGNTNGAGILGFGDTADSFIGGIQYEHANDSMNFFVNNSYRMTIDSAGAVYMPSVYADTVTGRDLYISSTGQLGYVSSTRASKTNIEDLSDVSWLYSLNPVSFQYRVRNEDDTYSDEAQPQPEYGLIAEEVEEVNPDLVFYDETESGKELRGVQYSRLIAPLLKAIQEQQKMISALEARIVALGG